MHVMQLNKLQLFFFFIVQLKLPKNAIVHKFFLVEKENYLS